MCGTDDADLMNPEWDKAGKVHDWRNYIGENTQAVWQTFTMAQRKAIALDADDRAGLEEWD